jgi:hypothetical protein
MYDEVGDTGNFVGDSSPRGTRAPATQPAGSIRAAPGSQQSARTPRPAKRIRGSCLSMRECHAWALAQGWELAGIWGGLSKLERRTLREGDAA